MRTRSATPLSPCWTCSGVPGRTSPHLVFAVFFEIVGLASARIEPYASLAPRLMDGWVAWLEPRVAASTRAQRRQQALAAVATLDGLLLLRRMSGARAANSAARELGLS